MLVSPSILAANFGNLDRDIRMLNASEASMIHIDVMDGVFVPNISIGFPVIQAVAEVATKPLDVHLMVVDPHRYIARLSELSVASMNVHYEACTHLHRTLTLIHEAGMRAAVTLNPSTPVEMLVDIINDVDMVLLMSVNPGFGGQRFIDRTIDRVRRLRRMIDDAGANVLIEIDGGVNLNTGKQLSDAGADVLVSGSAIFKAESPIDYISRLAALPRQSTTPGW